MSGLETEMRLSWGCTPDPQSQNLFSPKVKGNFKRKNLNHYIQTPKNNASRLPKLSSTKSPKTVENLWKTCESVDIHKIVCLTDAIRRVR